MSEERGTPVQRRPPSPRSTGERIEALSKGQRIGVLDAATVPDSPARPNRVKIALLGGIAGLVLGFGLVILAEPTDSMARLAEKAQEASAVRVAPRPGAGGRKHVIFVAILEEKTDDIGRRTFQLQLEGSKTALELPGVLDEVITLSSIKDENGGSFRAFVKRAGAARFPATDRYRRVLDDERDEDDATDDATDGGVGGGMRTGPVRHEP